jgi:two-component system LytT family response regulator
MRAVIVDDEPLARLALRQALAAHTDVAIVGEHAGGADAVSAISALAPDVLFVDIEMPAGGGFALVEQLDAANAPVVVFVTAYAQHAVRAYDAEALDYLLKPLDQARVDRAVARLRVEIGAGSRYIERLCVRVGDRAVILRADDLDWIATDGNYVVLHAGGEAYSHRASLAALASRLDPRRFTQIHRGTLIHVDRVVEVRRTIYGGAQVRMRDGTTLVLSRRYRATAMARLVG